MKKVITYIVLILLVGVVYQRRDNIYKAYIHFFGEKYALTTLEKNKYDRDYDFKYVQNTDKFIPENKQDPASLPDCRCGT